MFNWEALVERTRADVEASLNSWISVLTEFLGNRINYAYAKGSAQKPWDSPIDYVPIISDVDIHILLSDGEELFPESNDSFADSITMSQEYESKFIKSRLSDLWTVTWCIFGIWWILLGNCVYYYWLLHRSLGTVLDEI